jgi:hypothetical protein
MMGQCNLFGGFDFVLIIKCIPSPNPFPAVLFIHSRPFHTWEGQIGILYRQIPRQSLKITGKRLCSSFLCAPSTVKLTHTGGNLHTPDGG